MTTFDVLSGRLTLDTSPWQNALRQAQPALAQFVANMGRALDTLKLGITNVATALGSMTPSLAGMAATGAKVERSFEQSLNRLQMVTQTAAGALNTLGAQAGRWEPFTAPAVEPILANGAAGTGAVVGNPSSRLEPLPRWQGGAAAGNSEPMPALAPFVANMGRALDTLKLGITDVATALDTLTPAPASPAATGAKVEQTFEQSLNRLRKVTQTAAGALNTLGTQAGRWEPFAAPAVEPGLAEGAAGTGAGVENPSSRLEPLPRWEGGASAGNSWPMRTLMAYGEAFLAQFQRNAELLGQDRETSLKNARDVRTAVEGLASTVKLGDNDLEAFGKNAEEAATKAKELGDDMAALKNMAALDTAQENNAFQAEGMPAPQEPFAQMAGHGFMRHAMDQTLNQFAQMAQGAAMKIAMGPSELNDLIAQAQAKGNPLGALDLIIQNAQMKAWQANTNLHNLSDSLGDTGSAFGPRGDNAAYQASINSPAYQALKGFTDLLAQLQQQRAALVAHLAKGKQPPKMAEGGIVTDSILANIGEDGPEAVIPLERLAQVLAGVLPSFGSNSMFGNVPAIGQILGMTHGPFGSPFGSLSLNTGALGAFQAAFSQASNAVGTLSNAGFKPGGWMDRLQQLSQAQDAAVSALNAYQQHSQINLQPVRGSRVIGGTNPLTGSPWRGMPPNTAGAGGMSYSGDVSSFSGPNITVHVHGADLTTPAGARQVANLLVPHIDAVAKRMGTDMTGSSALRSMQQPFNAAPTSYAR